MKDVASPLGMFLGKYLNPNWNVYFLALSGGIFLHISSVIIFESNKNHKMDWEKMLLVVLGIGMALLGHNNLISQLKTLTLPTNY